MPYVKRNELGVIIGKFANRQDGFAEEYLDDDSEELVPSFNDLVRNKKAEINADFEAAIQQITAGYPASETSSWGKQETEARAYVANNSAPTPLIDALASSRSVDKAELVTRIITKADLFAGISGTLIGRRQGLEDDLDALPETATAEDIAAIAW